MNTASRTILSVAVAVLAAGGCATTEPDSRIPPAFGPGQFRLVSQYFPGALPPTHTDTTARAAAPEPVSTPPVDRAPTAPSSGSIAPPGVIATVPAPTETGSLDSGERGATSSAEPGVDRMDGRRVVLPPTAPLVEQLPNDVVSALLPPASLPASAGPADGSDASTLPPALQTARAGTPVPTVVAPASPLTTAPVVSALVPQATEPPAEAPREALSPAPTAPTPPQASAPSVTMPTPIPPAVPVVSPPAPMPAPAGPTPPAVISPPVAATPASTVQSPTPAQPPAPPAVATASVPLVSLRAEEVPLLTILRLLSQSAGLKLELGRGIERKPPISVEFVDEPVDAAVRSLVNDYGWEVVIDGDRLRVNGEVTRRLRLNFPHMSRTYATTIGGNTLGGEGGGSSAAVAVSYEGGSEDSWKAVEQHAKTILGQLGTVQIHKDTGVVWIKGRSDVVQEAVRELERIDYELSRQVFLDVSVIDVSISDRQRYGIDWGKVFELGQAAAWGSLSIAQPLSGIGGGLVGSAFSVTLSRRGERPDQIVLRALSEQGNARILSQPKILVTNGQTATMQVGEVLPYVSKVTLAAVPGVVVPQAIPQTGQPGTPDQGAQAPAGVAQTAQPSPAPNGTAAGAPTTPGAVTTPNPFGTSSVVATPTIDRVQSGLTIGISPRIQEDEILLQLTPVLNEVTSFKSFTVGTTSFEHPVIATKSLATVARARSGETVILGGLIDGKTRKAVDGVPVISRIPILGVLFRSEDHSVTSRELVILITPSIRPAGPLAPAPTTTPPARP